MMNAKCIKIIYVVSEYLHDALPTLGTSPAVRVMRDLVLSGHADEAETDIWFTSMSFIADPTREMIADVKVKKRNLSHLPLLEYQFFGIVSLVLVLSFKA